MTIQATFNREALNILTLIVSEISKVEPAARNRIITSTIQTCLSSKTPISTMTSKEIISFQENLLNKFRYLEWIKYNQ